jgi:hypothetical protein
MSQMLAAKRITQYKTQISRKKVQNATGKLGFGSNLLK